MQIFSANFAFDTATYERTIRCKTTDIRRTKLHLFVRSYGRPDMTFAVDWALSNNYLSIYLSVGRFVKKQYNCTETVHTLFLSCPNEKPSQFNPLSVLICVRANRTCKENHVWLSALSTHRHKALHAHWPINSRRFNNLRAWWVWLGSLSWVGGPCCSQLRAGGRKALTPSEEFVSSYTVLCCVSIRSKEKAFNNNNNNNNNNEL